MSFSSNFECECSDLDDKSFGPSMVGAKYLPPTPTQYGRGLLYSYFGSKSGPRLKVNLL